MAWICRDHEIHRADRALIERIAAGLLQPRLAPAQRKALHFALGKAHDDLGDYAKAMHHFEAANRIRSSAARLDRVTLERQIDRLIAATPEGFLGHRPELGGRRRDPNSDRGNAALGDDAG